MFELVLLCYCVLCLGVYCGYLLRGSLTAKLDSDLPLENARLHLELSRAERFRFGGGPYSVFVEVRGDGLWCVSDGCGSVLDRDRHWVFEPHNSSRTEEFLAGTRFTYPEAITLAQLVLLDNPLHQEELDESSLPI